MGKNFVSVINDENKFWYNGKPIQNLIDLKRVVLNMNDSEFDEVYIDLSNWLEYQVNKIISERMPKKRMKAVKYLERVLKGDKIKKNKSLVKANDVKDLLEDLKKYY